MSVYRNRVLDAYRMEPFVVADGRYTGVAP